MTDAVLRAWERVSSIDRMAVMHLRRWHEPRVTRAMRTFTHLGDAGSWVFVSLAFLSSGAAGARYGRLIGGATLLATGAVQLLKRRLKRPRPSATLAGFEALVENPDAFSFPSGHSAAAFAAAVATAGVGAVSPLLFALACCIAVSRVYLGAHYPLDVAVGILTGVLCGTLTRMIFSM